MIRVGSNGLPPPLPPEDSGNRQAPIQAETPAVAPDSQATATDARVRSSIAEGRGRQLTGGALRDFVIANEVRHHLGAMASEDLTSSVQDRFSSDPSLRALVDLAIVESEASGQSTAT